MTAQDLAGGKQSSSRSKRPRRTGAEHLYTPMIETTENENFHSLPAQLNPITVSTI